jgi:hypothetical protein
MLTKQHLSNVVLAALKRLGGSGSVVEVARDVWLHNEDELRASGDLFYTWQYDLRWAAQHLRDEGQLAPTARGAASRWTLSDS